MDSAYGVGNPNNNSVGFPPNMRLAYSTDGAVYRPLMPPPSYRDGGNGSSVAPPPYVDGGVIQAKKKRGRPRKNNVEGGSNISPLPPPPLQMVAVYDSSGGGDGFSSLAADSVAIHESKKKRGRPRKSAVEGCNIQLEAVYQSSGLSSPSTLAITAPSSGKKARGRPKGATGQKPQQVASMGSAALGFMPHIITVQAGEDIGAKIISFIENGMRGLCVLSANGAISNVTLRQVAISGGTVTYKGRFDILCLSGSFVLLESGGQRSIDGGLSVLLAGPDGRVLGGGVAGVLTAAAPVQIVISNFISGQEDFKSPTQVGPSTAPPNLVPGASTAGSPISWGTMSESSGGAGSPINQSTGAYNDDSNQQGVNSFSWLN